MADGSPLFLFIQLEFTHSLGPTPGSYLVGAADADSAAPPADPLVGITRAQGSADVLRIDVIGARPATRGRVFRRKPRDLEPGAEPREVPVAVATLVKATAPLASDEAERALERCQASEPEQEELVTEALAVLNRAIRAYRTAAWDPYVVEISRWDPRAIRIGYGTPQELAGGGWQEAFEPAPRRAPRLSRAERLQPDLLVAAVLGDRSRILHADDLIARALLDLELGRERSAALQLRAAGEMLDAELGGEGPAAPGSDDPARPASRRDEIESLASAAIRGELDERRRDRLVSLIEEVGALLHAWRSDQGI